MKRKISTCVYVYSILHHWVCILMFEGHLIEYVCRWEFVCELFEALHFLYSFFRVFWEWDEWLSLRSSVSLFFPHYIHWWCDFISCWIWVDHHYSSCSLLHHHSRFLLLIHPFHFTPCPLLTTTHFQVYYPLCIIITHFIISLFFFIASLLLSYSHLAPSGPWLMRFSVHVAFHTWGHEFLIIGYLSLVSFHFCYPITLAYVTSCVLRPPWGHEIRCRLRQPLLGQAFEIWSIFGYHHASSSGRHLFDVWTRSNCGFRWLGLHIWW